MNKNIFCLRWRWAAIKIVNRNYIIFLCIRGQDRQKNTACESITKPFSAALLINQYWLSSAAVDWLTFLTRIRLRDRTMNLYWNLGWKCEHKNIETDEKWWKYFHVQFSICNTGYIQKIFKIMPRWVWKCEMFESILNDQHHEFVPFADRLVAIPFI